MHSTLYCVKHAVNAFLYLLEGGLSLIHIVFFFFFKPNRIRMWCLWWWKDSYWCTSIPNEKGPLIHTGKKMFWKNTMQICLLSQKFMSKLLITAIWGKSLTPIPMVGNGNYSLLIFLRGNDPKTHEAFNPHPFF